MKDQLKELIENDYLPLESTSVDQVLQDMLDNIGHVDDDLRDHLIYPVLGTWITKGVLQTRQIKYVIQTLLENLSFGMGHTEDDSVFKRSFSVLQIPTCLYAHIQNNFLSPEEIKEITDAVLTYLEKEIDLRGYISGKGWAHSVAHTADALMYILKLPEVTVNDQIRILNGIRDKVMVDYYVYTNKEDERLVKAIMVMIERHDLEFETWISWLEGFKSFQLQKVMPNDMNVEVNVRNFLRSMYFSTEGDLHEKVKAVLEEA